MEKLQKKEKEMTDPFQSNCAASINLAHSGLNLAYHLGLIKTKQELSQISNDLVKTHSSLYVFLDEQHHLRHITYYDYQCTFSTQVTCPDGTDDSLEDSQRRDKAAKTMLEFWKKVWDQRQQMMEKRQQLLDPLLERLNPLLHQINKKPIISPYLRCWANFYKTRWPSTRLHVFQSRCTPSFHQILLDGFCLPNVQEKPRSNGQSLQ